MDREVVRTLALEAGFEVGVSSTLSSTLRQENPAVDADRIAFDESLAGGEYPVGDSLFQFACLLRKHFLDDRADLDLS